MSKSHLKTRRLHSKWVAGPGPPVLEAASTTGLPCMADLAEEAGVAVVRPVRGQRGAVLEALLAVCALRTDQCWVAEHSTAQVPGPPRRWREGRWDRGWSFAPWTRPADVLGSNRCGFAWADAAAALGAFAQFARVLASRGPRAAHAIIPLVSAFPGRCVLASPVRGARSRASRVLVAREIRALGSGTAEIGAARGSTLRVADWQAAAGCCTDAGLLGSGSGRRSRDYGCPRVEDDDVAVVAVAADDMEKGAAVRPVRSATGRWV